MPRARSSLKAILRGGIVLGAVLGMMQADAVFAYVQTGGVGTGQVAVAHTPLRVNQDTDMQPVGPGQAPQTLSGNFDNRNATCHPRRHRPRVDRRREARPRAPPPAPATPVTSRSPTAR